MSVDAGRSSRPAAKKLPVNYTSGKTPIFCLGVSIFCQGVKHSDCLPKLFLRVSGRSVLLFNPSLCLPVLSAWIICFDVPVFCQGIWIFWLTVCEGVWKVCLVF